MRSARPWPSLFGRLYRLFVDRGSSDRRHVQPIPRPDALERFEGMWVAVRDGEVVAAAPSSHQLAVQLRAMDHRKRAHVSVEYVRPTSDSYIVGVG